MGKKRKRKKTSQDKQSLKPEPLTPEKSAARKKKRRQPAPQRRESPNWPLTALAAAGMVLTAYLAFTSLTGVQPLYCDEGSTCDIVRHSRWGTFLGVPTALLGFLTYATLAFIGFKVRSPGWHWKSAWTVSLIGLGYSLYLNTISFFVIEAMCAYCLASLIIMAVIFILVVQQKPEGLSDFNFKALAGETVRPGDYFDHRCDAYAL